MKTKEFSIMILCAPKLSAILEFLRFFKESHDLFPFKLMIPNLTIIIYAIIIVALKFFD